jgi:hypothetical protein
MTSTEFPRCLFAAQMTTSTSGYFSRFDLGPAGRKLAAWVVIPGTGTFNLLHGPFAYSHRESNPLASIRPDGQVCSPDSQVDQVVYSHRGIDNG